MGSRHVEQNINIKRQHSKQSALRFLFLLGSGSRSGRFRAGVTENVRGQVSDFVTVFCPGKHKVRDKFTKGDYERDLEWTILGTQIKSREYFKLFWPAFFSFPLSGQGFHSFRASYLGFSFIHFDSPRVLWAGIFYLSPIWCECW